MDELISKRMAIDTFKDCAENGVGIDGTVDALESLPSAQPKINCSEIPNSSDDTISRQAAIAVADLSDYVGLSVEDVKKVTDEVIKGLKRLPSAQRWIPCSERLPKKEKKTYWVCTDTEYQCECRWTNNRFGFGEGEWGWSIFDTPQYSKPIAWQPLPTPYREGW